MRDQYARAKREQAEQGDSGVWPRLIDTRARPSGAVTNGEEAVNGGDGIRLRMGGIKDAD